MALRVKRHNFTACFVVDKGARYITPPLIWVPDTWGSERCPNLWPLGGNLKKSIPWFTPHCPPMPPSSDVSGFHICWKLSCQLLNTSSILTPLGNPGLNLNCSRLPLQQCSWREFEHKEVNKDWQRGQNKSNIMSSFKSRRGKRGLGNILERLQNWEKCLKSTERLREIVEWREDWAVFLFSAISLSASTTNGQRTCAVEQK